jgi:two-component system cell cycle response regulator
MEKRSGFEGLARLYATVLLAALVLAPAFGGAYLVWVGDLLPPYVSHRFHVAAIALATAEGLFITYVALRSYLSSGEPFLRWLTLAFMGFSLVYAPHGFLTHTADRHPMLFLLYGPFSRLVMALCMLAASLRFGAAHAAPERRGGAMFWLGAVALFAIIDIAIAAIALSPAAGLPLVRIVPEAGACALSVGSAAFLLFRLIRRSLMPSVAVSAAYFAQSSYAFLIARPWTHLWWFAHVVFATGFMLLSFAVIRVFLSTHSFSTVFSLEEVMQQLQRTRDNLARLASTDALTGTANRRHFFERAHEEAARTQRDGSTVSFLAIDLDHFKAVNDEHGHGAGDEVLRQVAAAWRALLRPSDLIGRVGGEEFLIMLPHIGAAEAAAVAERLRQTAAALFIESGGARIAVTVSIGVAQYVAGGPALESVLQTADQLLYAAKAQGRDRVIAASG